MLRLAVAGFQHEHIHMVIEEAGRLPGVVEFVGGSETEAAVRGKAEAYWHKPIYADHAQMLENLKPDIVGVAAINSEKAGIIRDSLRVGCHVIADKPLVITLEQLETIQGVYESVEKQGLRLSMLLTLRFDPVYRAVREIFLRGDVGEVVSIIAWRPHRLAPEGRPAWMFRRQAYGGIITDLAVHDIDIMRWVTSEEVCEVTAYHSNRRFSEISDFEDNGQVLLRFRGGTKGYVDASWLTPDGAPFHGDCRLIVFGTTGTAEVRTVENEVWLTSAFDGPHPVPLPDIQHGPLEDLLKAVRGESDLVLTAEEVFSSTRVALEARRSADMGGKTLTLPG